MDLSLILARLKEQLTGFKSIGQSADFAAAKAGALSLPGAFLLPLRDSATAMDMTGGTHEQIDQAFGVVLGMGNRRDVTTGAAALDELHPMRRALRAALVGWVPDASNGEAVHFSSGALLELDGEGHLWWMDEFTLTTYEWSA